MDAALIVALVTALGPSVIQLGTIGLTALIRAIQGSGLSPEQIAAQVLAYVAQSEASAKAAGASIDAAAAGYKRRHRA